MKKRIAVTAFLLTTTLAGTAAAELSLGMGTRWTATRWYNPVFPGDVSIAGNHLIMNSETALDAYFMLAFSKKFGLYLQLDYLNMSWACSSNDNDDVCTGDETGSMSFSSFGAELGMKYYFAEPRRAAISPLAVVGIYKYFASVDDADAEEDDIFALADLSSPWGGRVAIGVEYSFSNNFSVGAEIFGVRFALASTETVEEGDNAATIVAEDALTDYFSLSLYTALTLNFRFYGLFRVYTREEEEQASQEEAEDRAGRREDAQQGWGQEQPQQQQQWQQQPQQQQQWQQQPQQQQQWQQQPQQQQQQPQWQQQQQPQGQDPNQQWQQPQGGTTPTP